jgi:hypothetical protein
VRFRNNQVGSARLPAHLVPAARRLSDLAARRAALAQARWQWRADLGQTSGDPARFPEPQRRRGAAVEALAAPRRRCEQNPMADTRRRCPFAAGYRFRPAGNRLERRSGR